MSQLVRSQTDSMIGGVCGGLAQHFGIDSVLVRLGFVVITLIGGSGVLVYLILLLVMPLGDDTEDAPERAIDPEQKRKTNLIVGLGMIAIGAWYVIGQIPGLDWLRLGQLWPLLLIGLGVFMVFNVVRR